MGEKLYGLLGRKLGHSWSAPIHKALGCEDYRMFELEPEDLAAFLRREDIGGLNVTIPYKRDVMPLCDSIDEGAASIGSVNTLVRRDGKLHGYNTDIDGFLYMLRRADIDLAGKKVLVLGGGGASLTAQAAARRLGARSVTVISRSGPDNYENLDRHADAEAIINATPVGMWPDTAGRPVDLRCFPMLTDVADVIYNPNRTALLLQAEDLTRPAVREAEQEGHPLPKTGRAIRCTGGLPMLVRQAVAAEERFFDRSIPEEETERILADLRRDRLNLVLVGMPGCGKTTIGKLLSDLSGKPFVDLDQRIAERAGKSIPDIFAQEGESAFRKLEHQVLSEAANCAGQVIATGGGAVLRSENRLALRQSGWVCFLRRRLDALPRDGRPVSQANDLAELYRARLPLYRDTADASIDNDAAPEDAANQIWRDFLEYTRH